jgi:hypothetical protein
MNLFFCSSSSTDLQEEPTPNPGNEKVVIVLVPGRVATKGSAGGSESGAMWAEGATRMSRPGLRKKLKISGVGRALVGTPSLREERERERETARERKREREKAQTQTAIET